MYGQENWNLSIPSFLKIVSRLLGFENGRCLGNTHLTARCHDDDGVTRHKDFSALGLNNRGRRRRFRLLQFHEEFDRCPIATRRGVGDLSCSYVFLGGLAPFSTGF